MPQERLRKRRCHAWPRMIAMQLIGTQYGRSTPTDCAIARATPANGPKHEASTTRLHGAGKTTGAVGPLGRSDASRSSKLPVATARIIDNAAPESLKATMADSDSGWKPPLDTCPYATATATGNPTAKAAHTDNGKGCMAGRTAIIDRHSCLRAGRRGRGRSIIRSAGA